MEEKRTYQRTSFMVFVVVMAITLLLEYKGISVQAATAYVEALISKTVLLMSCLAPLVILIKEVVDDWRKSMHRRDVEVAKIEKLATLRQGR